MLFWYMYHQFSWRTNLIKDEWRWLHSMHLVVKLILNSVSVYLLFLWSCFRNVSSAVSSLFSLSSLSVPHHPCNIIQTVLWPSTHKGLDKHDKLFKSYCGKSKMFHHVLTVTWYLFYSNTQKKINQASVGKVDHLLTEKMQNGIKQIRVCLYFR